ncbi:hypothetical protein DNTS_018008 [Danionella cerebrum]|uniref:Retrotransposon gag domain-containing protein n=1 Tax=Danionella cerebrum TaxID=2873325 RepID=A0A553NK56_9TELE|nr:hypothetical protein DNTS_018008 [Danionella translucida]
MELSLAEIERALKEADDSLHELKRRRGGAAPDGASERRAAPTLRGRREAEAIPSTQRSSAAIKLPHYSGVTALEPYLAQVQLAAHHEGWSDGETAIKVALALEGPALQVLLDLAPEERSNFNALEAALKCRFGQEVSAESSRDELAERRRLMGESLGAFAAEVCSCVRRGFPTFPAEIREELALHAFVRGLAPERLRQHVRLAAPTTLQRALQLAEGAEEVFRASPTTPRPLPQRQHTRAAEREMPEEPRNEALASRAPDCQPPASIVVAPVEETPRKPSSETAMASWLAAGERPEWPAISSRGPELKILHSQWGNIELHNGVLYRRGTVLAVAPRANLAPGHGASAVGQNI